MDSRVFADKAVSINQATQADNSTTIKSSDDVLFQNRPNLFSSQTEITYNIPQITTTLKQ